MPAPEIIAGADRCLLVICDHASNAVPAGIDLGLPASELQTHIGWDIGAAALTRAVAGNNGCPAILASVSRLVVDCNRPPETCVPESSDGRRIPGNRALSDEARASRLAIHADHHAAIARLAQDLPQLIIAIHSFTPQLQTDATARPWPLALLWNRDDRAARLAWPTLAAESLPGPIGANQPYSGQLLNYTMNRHAEAAGIPYLNFEVRQDQLQDAEGIARHAAIISRAIAAALAGL